MEFRIESIDDVSPSELERILNRRSRESDQVVQAARDIIERVRRDKDAAVLEFTRRFDHVRLETFEIPAKERRNPTLPAAAKKSIEETYRRIVDYHKRGLPEPLKFRSRDGAVLGRLAIPYERAGIYAPGGRAAYPSTVLMAAAPAAAAGVKETILCTPPDRRGQVNPAVLYAAKVAGIDRVFRVGGAQAIAAMAYGTQSIPKVDIIVGPGNAFVSAAKVLVRDAVAIDFLAGPSEILIVSDGSTSARYIALDLASQAEHDPEARSIFVTTSRKQAEAVARELAALVPVQERAAIIEASLKNHGKILLARNLKHALDFANRYASEHLVLALQSAEGALEQIRNAGSIFLGAHSACAFGDYGVGPNHILPTAGEASRQGALSALTFLKFVPFQKVDRAAAQRLVRTAAPLAQLEGLVCHRLSMEARCDGER
jgi:histidinol dehydrogenase